MAEHNDLGKFGEQEVVDHLVAEGYDVVERNWRLNHMEIDIIATRGDEIAFVEVKTRTDDRRDPLEAMTPRKVALLSRAAEAYIRMNRIALTPRFDVVAVIGDAHNRRIEYHKNAFLPPLRTY